MVHFGPFPLVVDGADKFPAEVYWSSACVRESASVKEGGSGAVRKLLGLDPEKDNGDRCLGLFHVGMAKKEKIAQYRGKRGDVSQKLTWI